MGGKASCAQMCVSALDVGSLVPTPTYICLAVCGLEQRDRIWVMGCVGGMDGSV